MDYDISNLELSEIVNIAKETIGKKVFNLSVENASYPIIITKIHSPSISFEIWNRSSKINENKPIELERYLYYKTWDLYENNHYCSTIEDILEKHSFTLSEFDENESTLIKDLIRNNKKHPRGLYEDYYKDLLNTDEINKLFRETYLFTELTEYKFKVEFAKLLHTIATREIKSNEILQEKAIEYLKNKEKQEKEVEEHLEKLREQERKKEEFKKEFEFNRSKNSSDYNVRW